MVYLIEGLPDQLFSPANSEQSRQRGRTMSGKALVWHYDGIAGSHSSLSDRNTAASTMGLRTLLATGLS